MGRLHLCGCQDPHVAPCGQGREAGALHPPAVVAEAPMERRLPHDIPGEAHGGGVEAIADGDARALGLAVHRLELEVGLDHLAAPLMNGARGGADLRVGEAGQVLRDEVDEPAVALEQREDVEGLAVGEGSRDLGWRRDRDRRRLRDRRRGHRRGRRCYRLRGRGWRRGRRRSLDLGRGLGGDLGRWRRRRGDGDRLPRGRYGRDQGRTWRQGELTFAELLDSLREAAIEQHREERDEREEEPLERRQRNLVHLESLFSRSDPMSPAVALLGHAPVGVTR
jgi:hypothetical protein